MKQITLRLSASQLRQLDRLADKLQIDKANVIRLAITRLAESESIPRTSR
ncbi:MAG TPA: ribbon-helix-helix protein, CopG family [Acidisarcina sp.]|nr:ribbon-helix-helix protein, CopG family [Acidisarcina sp.]